MANVVITGREFSPSLKEQGMIFRPRNNEHCCEEGEFCAGGWNLARILLPLVPASGYTLRYLDARDNNKMWLLPRVVLVSIFSGLKLCGGLL